MAIGLASTFIRLYHHHYTFFLLGREMVQLHISGDAADVMACEGRRRGELERRNVMVVLGYHQS